jgi:hypothetical protein
VLELDARPLRRLGEEAHLDLARLLEVGLELPLWADVPADHDPMRRLVGEHARPAALAPVHAPVLEVAADARLEHGLRDLDREQVVLGRLEVGEDRERPLEWRVGAGNPIGDRICRRGFGAPWARET